MSSHEYVLDPARWPDMPPAHRAFLEHAIPALKTSFYPLERSGDVFSWDPI